MDPSKLRVEDIMTTDVYTVGPEEPVDLVGKIMQWKTVRHVPVEDRSERLVGMLSCFDVLQYLGSRNEREEIVTVAELMSPTPPTVGPEAPIGVALELMREQQVDALPVLHEQRLVGIVAERDFIDVVSRLIVSQPTPSDA